MEYPQNLWLSAGHQSKNPKFHNSSLSLLLFRYKAIYKSGGTKGPKVMAQGKSREREIANPNRLRIIGGIAKGKKIDSPDVYLRPMMAKVRGITHQIRKEKSISPSIGAGGSLQYIRSFGTVSHQYNQSSRHVCRFWVRGPGIP
jgi:hypothetical protein